MGWNMPSGTDRGNAVFYIGPGTDLVFQSMGGLLAALGAALAFAGVAARRFIGGFGKWKKKVPFLALVLLIAALALLWWHRDKGDTMRVIVIGFDGLDPGVTEQLMDAGRLPHFKRLAETGTFRRLETTVPPQSPVAWASFATGANPGRHGVFDFLKRDPRTYMPDLALTRVEQPKVLALGGIRIPLGRSKVSSCIQGRKFWDLTSDAGIPTTVLRHPLTFPPDRVRGKMLSGLGTPDVCGTQGTFSFYTTRGGRRTGEGGGRVIGVRRDGDVVRTEIVGPRNPADKDRGEVRVPLTITLAGETAVLSVQDTVCEVRRGQWSPWVRLRLRFGPANSISAICRFYVKSIDPHFEMYLSPLQFDPLSPAFPVSAPGGYARELARELGLFHTLGQAGDTWVLNEGLIDEEAALEQYAHVLDEDERVVFHELSRFDHGLFFAYFGISDTVQHMFYRDGAHAAGEIAAMYERMDAVLGRVMRYAGEDTLLIVVSDHGFGPFRRVVHLNAWLRDQGYLVTRGPGTSEAFFETVDWSRTRAYALGLSGIYLNRAGREKEGIVTPEEASRLAGEIAAKLGALRDTESGEPVAAKVYAGDIYRGPHAGQAPDLVVGFRRGWRCSWQTALGAVPGPVFENNDRHWRGDHIFDAGEVPGVLFVNRRLAAERAHITDIAPTVLKAFGIEIPPEMEGVPLL